MPAYPSQYYSHDEDDFDDYLESRCHHGNSYSDCDECDEEINARGGIDKCMNCGKYMYNDSLTYPGQTCIKGCRNPNEY